MFANRERPFVARIDEDGLTLLDSDDVIPFSEMLSIERGQLGSAQNPDQYVLYIHTLTRTVHVPHGINIPSAEFETFLRRRLPPRIVSVPDPDVDDYLSRQVQQFGADRVMWYRAAQHPQGRFARRSTRRGWIVFLMASLVVLAAGITLISTQPRGRRGPDPDGLIIAVGAVGTLLGLIGLAAHAGLGRGSQPRMKHPEQSSLVIGPIGIALRQGDLKGNSDGRRFTI